MQENKGQLLGQTENRYRWIILMLTTWIQTSSSFVTQGIGPLAAYWKDIYHLTQTETAAFVSTVNIGPILSMMILGKAIDRYGERWLLGISALLLGLTMAATLFFHHFYWLIILLLFVGVWYGASQPGGSKAIVSWFSVQERGLAMGIRQIGIPFGGALSAALLPWITEKYSLNSAILFQSIFSIVSGAIFLFIYKNNICFKDREVSKQKVGNLYLKEILKDKRLYPVFFSGITLVSLQFILVAHYITFLNNKLGISLTVAGIYLAIVQFSGMLGRITMAWISDKFYNGNRLKPLLFCIWFTVGMIIFLLFIDKGVPSWIVVLLSILLGFFSIGWYSLYIVQISETSPNNQVAFTVSVGLTLNQMAIVVMPILFGLAIDIQGDYFWAWLFVAILITFSGFKLHERKRNDDSHPI